MLNIAIATSAYLSMRNDSHFLPSLTHIGSCEQKCLHICLTTMSDILFIHVITFVWSLCLAFTTKCVYTQKPLNPHQLDLTVEERVSTFLCVVGEYYIEVVLIAFC